MELICNHFRLERTIADSGRDMAGREREKGIKMKYEQKEEVKGKMNNKRRGERERERDDVD